MCACHTIFDRFLINSKYRKKLKNSEPLSVSVLKNISKNFLLIFKSSCHTWTNIRNEKSNFIFQGLYSSKKMRTNMISYWITE